jgi:hypothetical protein
VCARRVGYECCCCCAADCCCCQRHKKNSMFVCKPLLQYHWKCRTICRTVSRGAAVTPTMPRRIHASSTNKPNCYFYCVCMFALRLSAAPYAAPLPYCFISSRVLPRLQHLLVYLTAAHGAAAYGCSALTVYLVSQCTGTRFMHNAAVTAAAYGRLCQQHCCRYCC